MELTEEQIKAIVEAAKKVLTGDKVQVYEEIYEDTTGTVTSRTQDFTKVDSGKIRVITHIAAYDNTSSPTSIKFQHTNGGQTAIDKTGVAPLTGETVNWDGAFILTEGDKVSVLWAGITSGDDLYAVVSGYEITK